MGTCSFGEIQLQTEVESMMKREQGRNAQSLSVPTPQASVSASRYPTPLEARGPGCYDEEQGDSLPGTPQARRARGGKRC